MALVCDLKSMATENAEENPDVEDGEITDDDEEEVPEPAPEVVPPNPATSGAQPTIPVIPKPIVSDCESTGTSSRDQGDLNSDREKSDDKEGREKGKNRKEAKKSKSGRGKDEKGHRHMTEAERSILHLRKREKMMRQREKWEKHHRVKEVDPMEDDFAKHIEKTLATILHKKEKEVAAANAADEEPKEEEKRGKKRKSEQRRDKTRNKQKKITESDEVDESEVLNIRSGSPGAESRQTLNFEPPAQIRRRSRSVSRSEESYNSDYSFEDRDDRRRRQGKYRRKKDYDRREKKHRDKIEREHRRLKEESKKMAGETHGVCVFYLQGKCQKSDCPYSHEVTPPMKLELCKFYLMDCCAKGENCSYMHSEFPCKFYHTGLACAAGKDCKFAHGKPLSEDLRQILFKHIETAPRDILQGFPRLSRDEALDLINKRQSNLAEQLDGSSTEPKNAQETPTEDATSNVTPLGMYREQWDQQEDRTPEKVTKGGIPSLFDLEIPLPAKIVGALDLIGKKGDNKKNKNSRWSQDEDGDNSSGLPGNAKGFYGTDQDMRFSSNGDVDMRTLPTIPVTTSSVAMSNPTSDVDIRFSNKDIDIRQAPFAKMDVDARLNLDSSKEEVKQFELPLATRNLLARITANQRDTVDNQYSQDKEADSQGYNDQNINWYSDDDDDDDENRLMIKVEDDEQHKKEKEDSASDREGQDNSFVAPSQLKTSEIVEKLGDLSKIDISVEVTKLLTSMSQNKNLLPSAATKPKSEEQSEVKPSISSPRGSDPRMDPRMVKARTDPRSGPDSRPRRESKEEVREKIDIYSQGGMDMNRAALAVDNEEFKASRPDVDLRSMALPFKGMQNYTPATEIDARINSHPPMAWNLYIVDIPRPDYSGLKLSISDAEKTGDPRLRKIFRLSIDEKDSPASPKASPKANAAPRVDPRLRRAAEKDSSNLQLTYNQQLTMLQSSDYYQNLTSKQKVDLNDQLSQNDQNVGMTETLLHSLLLRLNLMPQSVNQQQQGSLASNPLMATISTMLAMNKVGIPNQHMMGQQGILGSAPGVPNSGPNMQMQDFQMNFDPRGGPGILGNGPPPGFGPYGGMDQQGGFGGGFNDDYYPEEEPPYMGPQSMNMGPPGGNFRGRGFNNNNRDNNRRRGNREGGFRGGRGNMRGFHNKRGGFRDHKDRHDRDRGRHRHRGNVSP